MLGAAGNALFFIGSLMVCGLLTGYTLCYAAHCYLVVVQGTTAGIDKVRWPDEPFFDWIRQSLLLCFLVLIWLAPIGILSRALGSEWLVHQPSLRFLILAVPALWILFPITLLSSLASSSRWQILSGRVIVGLFRLAPAMLLFYLVSAVLIVSATTLGYLGLFSATWHLIPVAAAVGSAGWLIHARLVGRLGWKLQQLTNSPIPKRNRPPEKKAQRKSKHVKSHDPWAIPEEQEEESNQIYALEGYKVEEVKPRRPAYMDPEPDPYEVADEPTPQATRPQVLELNQAQVQREIELRTRTPPNPSPKYLLFSGVYTFPFYATTLKVWFQLSLWALLSGGSVRLARLLFPF
jgi:hypothetical protein